jgi:hypothetical protein
VPRIAKNSKGIHSSRANGPFNKLIAKKARFDDTCHDSEVGHARWQGARMKKLLLSFPGSYSRTLRKHLAAGAPSDLSGARRLGRNARSINLTANELAEIHKKAMKEITSPQGTAEKRARARRAFSFLSQVTASAAQGEATVAPPSNSVLRTALAEMTRRATGLAAANDALKNEIARRETARLILQKDNDAAHEELFRSRHLAEEMRHLSHRLLTAQEDERRSISRELHDVVVQALTSIHLRLTVLKTQSSLSPEISKRKNCWKNRWPLCISLPAICAPRFSMIWG